MTSSVAKERYNYNLTPDEREDFVKWFHEQDPKTAIEEIRNLAVEDMAAWQVGAPLDAEPFFRKWLDHHLYRLYSDPLNYSTVTGQILETLYHSVIKDFDSSLYQKNPTQFLDQLARAILKEYSHIWEEKATSDEVLKPYFKDTLGLSTDSELMKITLCKAKPSIKKIVQEWLGYMHNDKPRQFLKNVLSKHYPGTEKVSFLADVYGNSKRRVFAPIWEQ